MGVQPQEIDDHRQEYQQGHRHDGANDRAQRHQQPDRLEAEKAPPFLLVVD